MLTNYAHTAKVETIFRYWDSIVFAGMTNMEAKTAVVSRDKQALDEFLLDADEETDHDGPPATKTTSEAVEKRVTFANTVQEIPKESLLEPVASEVPRNGAKEGMCYP